MGEYECWDCDKKFHLEEPPYDGREICDEFGIDTHLQSNFDPIFRPTEELFKKIDKLLEVTNG